MIHLHIIGAGVAGLACAVAARRKGFRGPLSLYEAAPQAGGRCRSLTAPGPGGKGDTVGDAGTHLLLSANRAVLDLAETCGGMSHLTLHPPHFPFIDLREQAHWTLAPGPGPLPWWLLDPRRRVPGVGAMAHLWGLGSFFLPVGPTTTVAKVFQRCNPLLVRRLLAPLAVNILNTAPAEAAAAPLRQVIRESLGRGAAFCRPITGRHGLGAALIAPALSWLHRQGVRMLFSTPLRRIERREGDGLPTALHFRGGLTVPLDPDRDRVVLALPPPALSRLLGDRLFPALAHRQILTLHLRLAQPLPHSAPPFLGCVGGTIDWIQWREEGEITLTVSNWPATARPKPAALWAEAVAALALAGIDVPLPLPPHRVILDRRATLAHTPEQQAVRAALPHVLPPLLWLAGDWQDAALPCTLEAAARSGQRAAAAVLGSCE